MKVDKNNKHMLIRTIILFVIMLSLSSLSAFSQNIKIKIDAPKNVQTGEQFRVNYIIEGDKPVNESIIFKDIEGFKILYGPAVSTSSSTYFKNGKRVTTYSATSTYYLEALKAGKFTLPSAEVRIDGKKYKSDSFKLTVKEREDASKDIEAFIRPIVSKSSLTSVSDTLTVTYKLYSTKEIRRVVNANYPSFTDFYALNVTPKRQMFSDEEYDGKMYKVVDLRKLILQPKNVGLKEIPDGKVTVEYSIPTGKKIKNEWGEVLNEVIRTEKTMEIEPITIRVQELKAI